MKHLSYLFMPLLISALFVNEGLASLSFFIMIAILLIMSLLVSAAHFGEVENLRAAFTKKNTTFIKVFARSMTAAYIVIAAYQGHVFVSIVVLILWVYVMIVRSVLADNQILAKG